ncbi:MAG TPA: ATP-binding protein, partial [Spirochaetota bacterium]|nr:ATP-binding protein [Spirochaetota bacterium]
MKLKKNNIHTMTMDNDPVNLLKVKFGEEDINFNGKNILVLVSGGSDSMVLLHLMQQAFSGQYKNLAVLNINYCLRAEESL